MVNFIRVMLQCVYSNHCLGENYGAEGQQYPRKIIWSNCIPSIPGVYTSN